MKAQTIGALRASGYEVLSIRHELRKNLIDKIRRNEALFPGIIGYEESVIPAMENAILSGHDIIMLGERGQGKTRIIRTLINLLDEEIPVIAGCEINDDPYHPICRSCRDRVMEFGDSVEIEWLPRERRYAEKLATPDTTIADLIGEVDPIKVAEGRYLADELTLHYGLIPRTNRGVFAINELPDLAERIQVGLLNIMEERDVQIRGYKIRLPLDVFVVATANPEDYTNRGRIITPLKDRFGAEVRTHYPKTAELELSIVEQERASIEDGDLRLTVPFFMEEIIAEITTLARRSPDVNQRSGVSVRVSIANYETMVANATRRAIRTNEREIVPRASDLPYVASSTGGKIELESLDENRDSTVVDRLIRNAVLNVFNRYFRVQEFEDVVTKFDQGKAVDVSDALGAADAMRQLSDFVPDLRPALKKIGCDESPATMASGAEFIFEGLHLNKKLNKDKVAGTTQYRGAIR